jgi:hypothetical protein
MASFVAGAGALLLGALAFWIALPRRGQVRSFLKGEAAQAYFTVAIIVLVAFGGVNLFRGIWLISE